MTAPPLPPGHISQMFDRIHGRYDLLNKVLSLGLDGYWRRRAIRELNLAPGSRVVDLCCGTGDLSAELVAQGHTVVGVDFAPQMLERARSKYPGILFVQGDATRVPLEGGYDAITMAFGPRNIHDLPALWRETQRLLRPGGRLMTLELTRPPGVLGLLHRLYLGYVLPVVGRLLSGDSAAYRYLSQTIAGFLDRDALSRSMREGGLAEVRAVPLTGGIVTVHCSTRP